MIRLERPRFLERGARGGFIRVRNVRAAGGDELIDERRRFHFLARLRAEPLCLVVRRILRENLVADVDRALELARGERRSCFGERTWLIRIIRLVHKLLRGVEARVRFQDVIASGEDVMRRPDFRR